MRPFPTLSIVVPGYCNAGLSRQVLTDIISTQNIDNELIFIDDGSTDDTESQVRSLGDAVTYIKHPENRGVSPAWNTGIKAATGEFICILNNDLRINDQSWMTKLVDAVKGQKAIAAPEIIDYNSASAFNGKNVPYPNGWCFIFPRRFFTELGLFEERFAPASFEDVDIGARASQAGYQLKQVDIRAQHSYSATVGRFLRGDMPRLNERNRKIWLEKMQAADRPRLKIVFDCPSNGRKWGPYTLEEEGLGGAETAITFLSRELVSRGHEVFIFNDLEQFADQSQPGPWYYHRREVPNKGLDCDIFVAFRCPSEYITQAHARRKIFWSCDQQTTPPETWDRGLFPFVDTTVCISDYHAEFLAKQHGKPLSDFTVIGCPVQSWDYEPHPEKIVEQFIFCSVPHRGLSYMPMVMGEIRKQLSEATLIVTSDYRLWGAPEPRNEEFKPIFLRDSKTQFLGRVSRPDLIRYQLESMGQPYPCTYEEMFCIAVAECSAAGAVPVSTQIGAVPQTLGDPSRIVGPPDGDFAQRVAARMLEVYGDADVMRRTIEESWRYSLVTIANHWESLFYEGLEARERQEQETVDFGQDKTVTPSGDIISTRAST